MRGNNTDTVVYKLNDLTKKFKALVENTFECFHNNTHVSGEEIIQQNFYAMCPLILPQDRSIVFQYLALKPSQGLFSDNAVSLLMHFCGIFHMVCIV